MQEVRSAVGGTSQSHFFVGRIWKAAQSVQALKFVSQLGTEFLCTPFVLCMIWAVE